MIERQCVYWNPGAPDKEAAQRAQHVVARNVRVLKRRSDLRILLGLNQNPTLVVVLNEEGVGLGEIMVPSHPRPIDQEKRSSISFSISSSDLPEVSGMTR